MELWCDVCQMALRRGAKGNRRGYRVDFAVPSLLHLAFANGGDLPVFLDRERVMWDESDVLRLVWKRVEADLQGRSGFASAL